MRFWKRIWWIFGRTIPVCMTSGHRISKTGRRDLAVEEIAEKLQTTGEISSKRGEGYILSFLWSSRLVDWQRTGTDGGLYQGRYVRSRIGTIHLVRTQNFRVFLTPPPTCTHGVRERLDPPPVRIRKFTWPKTKAYSEEHIN